MNSQKRPCLVYKDADAAIDSKAGHLQDTMVDVDSLMNVVEQAVDLVNRQH